MPTHGDESIMIINPPVALVVRETCKQLGITPEYIHSKKRDRRRVQARQTVQWVVRYLTEASYPSIAESMGGINHTTIMHSIQKVDQRRRTDPKFRRDLDALTEGVEWVLTKRANQVRRILPEAV